VSIFANDQIDIEDCNDLSHTMGEEMLNVLSNNKREQDKTRIKNMMKNCSSSLNFHKPPQLKNVGMEDDCQQIIYCSSVKNSKKTSEETRYRSHTNNVSSHGFYSKLTKFSPFKHGLTKKLKSRKNTIQGSKSFALPSGSSISVRHENQIYVRSLEEFVNSNIN
jgi:hypothetical protein